MSTSRKDAKSGQFVSDLSAEQLEDIAASVVLGQESQRALAARLGLPRSTVQRAIRRSDVQAIIRSLRARSKDAERKRADRAIERAIEHGVEPESARQMHGKKPRGPRRKTPKSSADGRLLGWGSFNATGGEWRYVVNDPEHPGSYDSEQAWRDLPREEFGPNVLACVVHPLGSTAFDPLDDEDRARATVLVHEARPDLRFNDILATLASVPRGRRITFEVEQ